MHKLEREHRKPSQPLPPGAADCHMHVFGPFARFPLAAERAYTVDEAPLAAHERMKRQVGLERTVFVQASGHGFDNRALLAALGELGERARGVAVAKPEASTSELQAMHSAGVRGLRLNLYTVGGLYGNDVVSVLKAHEALVAPLGWHLQLFCSAETLLSLKANIEKLSVPVVIDHMGMPDAALGIDQPVFRALLSLVENPNVWVKLTGADRITRATGRVRDAVPFIRALAGAAPERLVWGSDWPNIGFHQRQLVTDTHVLAHRELDAGELLDVLIEAVPQAPGRDAILARNPETLYGFATPRR